MSLVGVRGSQTHQREGAVMAASAKVLDLVERFDYHLQDYKQGKYADAGLAAAGGGDDHPPGQNGAAPSDRGDGSVAVK
jgi:hypothetical protein